LQISVSILIFSTTAGLPEAIAFARRPGAMARLVAEW
jgi:hypothetical protein